MAPIDIMLHLLGFVAPAFFVALAVTFASRWLRLSPQQMGWWRQTAINFTVGVGVLAAGLWHFGVDGKMATYAALAVAVATAQWICSRGWKH